MQNYTNGTDGYTYFYSNSILVAVPTVKGGKTDFSAEFQIPVDDFIEPISGGSIHSIKFALRTGKQEVNIIHEYQL